MKVFSGRTHTALKMVIAAAFMLLCFAINPINAKADGSLREGTYVIHSALNDKKVLDISGASLDNGGNLQPICAMPFTSLSL